MEFDTFALYYYGVLKYFQGNALLYRNNLKKYASFRFHLTLERFTNICKLNEISKSHDQDSLKPTKQTFPSCCVFE